MSFFQDPCWSQPCCRPRPAGWPCLNGWLLKKNNSSARRPCGTAGWLCFDAWLCPNYWDAALQPEPGCGALLAPALLQAACPRACPHLHTALGVGLSLLHATCTYFAFRTWELYILITKRQFFEDKACCICQKEQKMAEKNKDVAALTVLLKPGGSLRSLPQTGLSMGSHTAWRTEASAPLPLSICLPGWQLLLTASCRLWSVRFTSPFDLQLSLGKTVLCQPGERCRSNPKVATHLFILVGPLLWLVLLGFNSPFDLPPTQITSQDRIGR